MTTTSKSNEAQTDTRYLVLLQQQKGGEVKTIQAYLPQSFQFSLASTYDSIVANAGSAGEGTTATALSLLGGLSTQVNIASLQMWQGSEIPMFTLPLQLETETDPIQDIRQNILTLISWVTPSRNSLGVITTPGPKIDPEAMKNNIESSVDSIKANKTSDTSDPSTNKQSSNKSIILQAENKAISSMEGTIQISLGNYLYFPNCVITNVTFDIQSIMDYAVKWPQSVEVQLEFKPVVMPTYLDWAEMMLLPKSNAGQLGGFNQANGVIGNIVGSVTSKVQDVANKVADTTKNAISGFADSASNWINDTFS